MRNLTLTFLCVGLLACGKDATDGDDTGAPVDADNDGFFADSDCDDNDADVNPDAAELCDGVDNNCDGVVDEDEAEDAGTWYADSDADGFGDAAVSAAACAAPSGYVEDNTDCDDTNVEISPDGTEVCNDADDDCDTEIDEDATDMSTWYADGDADGYGDMNASSLACEAASGTVDNGDDCDDTNGAINPDAAEVCDGVDNDCDAATLEDGMVTWTDTAGVASDVTADLTGTATSPALYSLSEGHLNFCDGTYYVNLALTGEASLGAQNQDPTAAILDGAGFGTVVTIRDDGSDVSLTDLTLQGGEGGQDSQTGEVKGGGLDCNTVDQSDGSLGLATVALDNVLITGNNSSYLAGGILSAACDLTIENSEISYNTALDFAGFYLVAGTHAFTGTDILSNVSEEGFGAGVIFGNAEGTLQGGADFDEVVLQDNSAEDFPGIGFAFGEFTWKGSTGASGSGAWNNLSPAENESAGLIVFAAEFEADTVDFGNSTDGTDNAPVDIILQTSSYDLIAYWAGDDASFTCGADACGTSDSYNTGGAESSWGINDDAYAGLIEANSTRTLDSFDINTTGSTTGCFADFYLMEDAGSGSWDVLWSNLGVSVDTAAPTDSGTVGIPAESGVRYAVGVAFSGCNRSVSIAYGHTNPGTDAGWGTVNGLATYNSYSAGESSYKLTESSFNYNSIEMNFNSTEL